MTDPTFNDLIRGHADKSAPLSDEPADKSAPGDVDAGRGEGDPRQFETVRDEDGRPQLMEVIDLNTLDGRNQ